MAGAATVNLGNLRVNAKGLLPLVVFKIVQTPFSCWRSIGDGGVQGLTIQ